MLVLDKDNKKGDTKNNDIKDGNKNNNEKDDTINNNEKDDTKNNNEKDDSNIVATVSSDTGKIIRSNVYLTH